MTVTGPPRVDDIERYWRDPPPEQTARCTYWLEKVKAGWRRNRRIKGLGYYSSATYFGVYIWEWINVLGPAIWKMEGGGA